MPTFSSGLDVAQADFVRATEATSSILDEIGLVTYLFEVEPREGAWQVKIECATQEGAWQTLTISTPAEVLVASLEDPEVHSKLVAQWSTVLAGCHARRV